MRWRERWKRWKTGRVARLLLFLLGSGLIVASPVVGILPGPGGILLFAAGFTLVLETSAWAKRAYVRFKRRWPRAGGWIDRGLRRASEQRRRTREKQARHAPSHAGLD